MIKHPLHERMARALEALSEGVVVHDPDGAISACNPAAERILGAPADELLGLTALDGRLGSIREDGSPLDGDDHPVIMALRTEQPQLGVVIGIHKPDGSLTWLLVNATPFPDAGFGGVGPAVITSLVDVTAVRRLEAELAASEQIYRATVDHAPHGIAFVDLDGNWVRVNPALCAMTGYSEAELLALGPRAIAHPDDGTDIAEPFRALLAGELDSWEMERRYVRSDGGTLWAQVTIFLVRDERGEPVHFVSQSQDITQVREDRARLGDQAREQEALKTLATLIASGRTPSAVFSAAAEQAAIVLDADHGGVVQIHPTGPVYLAGSWSAPGFPIVPAGTPLSLEAPTAVAAVLRTGRIANVACYDPPLQNPTIPTRSAVAAPIEVNGRLWGAVTVGWAHEAGAGVDANGRIARIADLVSLSVAAAEARQQLARDAHASRIESLGQLAGGVAHDFNNLIGVILNYARFAEEALPDDSPVRADLREIMRAAESAGELTQQLLTFGRGQSIERQVLALNELVGDLASMLQRTLGDHVRLHTELEPDLAPIFANRGQLAHLLINLALNARDAMPSGGKLTIATANTVLDQAAVAREPDLSAGAYVRLEVSDDGAGMSADVREHAFEPFFTTKPTGQGAGLGLATVHGIVAESRGTIKLTSEPGLGTTCTIYLPAIDQAQMPEWSAAADPAPPVSVGSPASHGGRILVVDDQDALRRATVRALSSAGYLVSGAGTAADALKLLAAERFDLLLSDVVMPEMLGPELAARAIATDNRLRVIYMSGYLDPTVDVGPGAPARDRVLSKPFGQDELLAAVAAALAPAQA